MLKSTLRRAGGWACEELDGRKTEFDTFSCSHCNRVVIVQHKSDPDKLGGFCFACTKMVCPDCVGKGCDVIEKKLEREEARYHALRSYGV